MDMGLASYGVVVLGRLILLGPIRQVIVAGAALFAVAGYSASAFAQFETRSATPVNSVPLFVVAADFNHDGKMDIAVASTYPPAQVQVFLGERGRNVRASCLIRRWFRKRPHRRRGRE